MKKILFIGLIGLIFAFAAEKTMACSCVVPQPGETLKKQVSKAKGSATAIFVGKVVSVRYSDEKLNGVPMKMYAKLEVIRSWKGPTTASIEVETANICCICGYTFENGNTYIIYSNSPDLQSISVSSCSRTAMITGTSGDEKYLGRAKRVIRVSK